jgi:hypothetical protein
LTGVVKRNAVKLQTRMRSGTIDSGIRKTAQNEAYKPKIRPPRKILQRRVEISRPSEQWTEPNPRTEGSLKKTHRERD